MQNWSVCIHGSGSWARRESPSFRLHVLGVSEMSDRARLRAGSGRVSVSHMARGEGTRWYLEMEAEDAGRLAIGMRRQRHELSCLDPSTLHMQFKYIACQSFVDAGENVCQRWDRVVPLREKAGSHRRGRRALSRPQRRIGRGFVSWDGSKWPISGSTSLSTHHMSQLGLVRSFLLRAVSARRGLRRVDGGPGGNASTLLGGRWDVDETRQLGCPYRSETKRSRMNGAKTQDDCREPTTGPCSSSRYRRPPRRDQELLGDDEGDSRCDWRARARSPCGHAADAVPAVASLPLTGILPASRVGARLCSQYRTVLWTPGHLWRPGDALYSTYKSGQSKKRSGPN
nr:hypothetical protein CFP56_24126 [Quercus suber]